MNKKRIIILTASVAIFIITGLIYSTARQTDDNKTTAPPKPTRPAAQKLETFDKTKHSLIDPNSIWVIVNKRNALQPKDFKPSELVFPDVSQRVPGNESMQARPEVARAVESMFADAKQQKLNLEISSAYRSYGFQVTLYDDYVSSQGQAVADTQSARPGHSEHQTGLVVDIQPQSGKCHLDECFGDLAEGKWLKDNAYKYGFILRYPKDKQPITGYIYEPWHFRYVGTELASEMHKQKVETLEEFFGYDKAPDYQ